jgi:epoxyqueuosine reductase
LHEDVSPLVRGHAAWALGEIGGEAAEVALKKMLEEEADGKCREEIEHALVGLFGAAKGTFNGPPVG